MLAGKATGYSLGVQQGPWQGTAPSHPDRTCLLEKRSSSYPTSYVSPFPPSESTKALVKMRHIETPRQVFWERDEDLQSHLVLNGPA